MLNVGRKSIKISAMEYIKENQNIPKLQLSDYFDLVIPVKPVIFIKYGLPIDTKVNNRKVTEFQPYSPLSKFLVGKSIKKESQITWSFNFGEEFL